MDRGAWQATVHEIAKELDMIKRLKKQEKSNRCMKNSWKLRS